MKQNADQNNRNAEKGSTIRELGIESCEYVDDTASGRCMNENPRNKTRSLRHFSGTAAVSLQESSDIKEGGIFLSEKKEIEILKT